MTYKGLILDPEFRKVIEEIEQFMSPRIISLSLYTLVYHVTNTYLLQVLTDNCRAQVGYQIGNNNKSSDICSVSLMIHDLSHFLMKLSCQLDYHPQFPPILPIPHPLRSWFKWVTF